MAKSNEGSKKATVRAAGCVVYRRSDGGSSIELLIAHRPKYDDWAFPKGHVEEGETELEAAERETMEEVCVAGTVEAELPTVFYKVKGNRDKSVRWWLLRYGSGEFVANSEVDEVAWVCLDEVAERLSYENDASLLPYVRRALEPSDQVPHVG